MCIEAVLKERISAGAVANTYNIYARVKFWVDSFLICAQEPGKSFRRWQLSLGARHMS